MIDFETLGQKPDTAVLSLGAVLFNRMQILEEKLWHFSLDGQLEIGRRSVTGSTIIWWMQQDNKAKEVFERLALEGILIKDFAPQFIQFCDPAGADLRVWGNGATFDIPIAEHILESARIKPPWKFWNQRCYRTMKACFGVDRKFEGVKHNALDDSRHQAKCLIEFWAKHPEAEK